VVLVVRECHLLNFRYPRLINKDLGGIHNDTCGRVHNLELLGHVGLDKSLWWPQRNLFKLDIHEIDPGVGNPWLRNFKSISQILLHQSQRTKESSGSRVRGRQCLLHLQILTCMRDFAAYPKKSGTKTYFDIEIY
jgi:hypothetical protein